MGKLLDALLSGVYLLFAAYFGQTYVNHPAIRGISQIGREAAIIQQYDGVDIHDEISRINGMLSQLEVKNPEYVGEIRGLEQDLSLITAGLTASGADRSSEQAAGDLVAGRLEDFVTDYTRSIYILLAGTYFSLGCLKNAASAMFGRDGG